MPKRDDINKVMIIGSGPIVIGQAAVVGRLADVGQPTRQVQPTRQMQPKRWILGENAWKLGVEG